MAGVGCCYTAPFAWRSAGLAALADPAWRLRGLAAASGLPESGFTEDLAFWEENLRGAPGNYWSCQQIGPARQRSPIGVPERRFRLDPPLTAALRDCGRREKTSLFTIFAAALNTLLYRYTGIEDISAGDSGCRPRSAGSCNR